MQFAVPTKGQVLAFGRNMVAFGGGAVATAATFHVISQGDATSATGAISQIVSGVTNITTGLGTLLGIAMGVWAAWKSSPFAKLLETSKMLGDQGTIVLKDPKLAAALPDNVVAAPLARPGQN